MAQLTIIDYIADGDCVSEKVLDDILKAHNATVTNWVEKEYGLKVFITVPDSKLSDLKEIINHTRNFSCDL